MASNTTAGIGTDLEVINACLELVMSMNSKNYLQRVLEILVGHCQAVCGHIGDTGNTYFAKYPSDDIFDKHEGFSMTFALGFGKYLHNAVGQLVLCRATAFDEHLLSRIERLLPAISCIFLICKNYTEYQKDCRTTCKCCTRRNITYC